MILKLTNITNIFLIIHLEEMNHILATLDTMFYFY